MFTIGCKATSYSNHINNKGQRVESHTTDLHRVSLKTKKGICITQNHNNASNLEYCLFHMIAVN